MTIESTNDNIPTTPAITYSECYAQVFLGDCLEQHEHIKSGSVDLILTDLPYGTIKGLGGDIEKYKRLSNSEWDNVIPVGEIMLIANRILLKNGKILAKAGNRSTTADVSTKVK